MRKPKADIKVIEHPRDGTVFANLTTEAMRTDHCMCFHCDLLKPDQPDNCTIAQRFFEACKDGPTALMVTRCRFFKPKETK